jgi:nucleoside-diphosphate-sugar epimerase
MPNVLVLGATGYLGLAVGQSLLRSGNHAVWGLARSEAKGKLLAANEMSPIIGDVADLDTLISAITSASIDIVVDCTSAYEQATSILKAVIEASKIRTTTLGKENTIAPKLGFVYTSGAWVHGSPGSRVSDFSPVGTSLSKGKAATATNWRPAHEQAILAARDVLEVAILRPSNLYGRASSLFGVLWGPLLGASMSGSSNTIQLPLDRAARLGTNHVDDVAAAFHAAIDRIYGGLGSWPVFDLVGDTVSLVEIMEGAKAALGVKAPIEYVGPQGNPLLEAVSLVSYGDAARARTVLGWEAEHGEFLLNLPVTVMAWKAAQGG